MNGHTFLRNYRVLMFLGMISFMGTAFIYTMPEDFLVEEYTLVYSEELRLDTSKIAFLLLQSMLFKTGLLLTLRKSTAFTCMRWQKK